MDPTAENSNPIGPSSRLNPLLVSSGLIMPSPELVDVVAIACLPAVGQDSLVKQDKPAAGIRKERAVFDFRVAI
jgi:hypothetical protein